MLIQLNSTSKPFQIRVLVVDICQVAINEVIIRAMPAKKVICHCETGYKNRIFYCLYMSCWTCRRKSLSLRCMRSFYLDGKTLKRNLR